MLMPPLIFLGSVVNGPITNMTISVDFVTGPFRAAVEPLFVSPVTIDIGEFTVEGYAYYDQKREQQERQSFYKRVYDSVENLKKIEIR
ncbi:Uncharacterised protein [uncultured archaeon]|nr:Uncharacterised protein [uncultured archaeon]